MSVTTKQKQAAWESKYGNAKKGKDPFDSQITINDFTIDHILPLENNGSNIKENLIPMSEANNATKSDKLSGKVNNMSFSVTRQKRKDGKFYGILRVNNKVIEN